MNRHFIALLIALLTTVSASAYDKVIKIVHGSITDYADVTAIDSICFTADGTSLIIQPVDDAAPVSILRSEITDIRYISSDDCPSKLKIAYDGSSATIHNPYFLSGVSVSTDGAYVTVNNTNTSAEYTTELTGTTTDGAFTYNGSYKTTIVLAGVSITSSRGAAVDIECGKRVALELKKSTVNTLVDSSDGSQKAALYCKGHLEIDKSGTLSVTGRTAHAISAKEYIKLKKSDGIINIVSAVKDGIHCKQYFMGNGFTVNIDKVGDDGIQSELDGEANDDDIVDGTLIINGGTYCIINSTNASMDDSDVQSAKGLNADGNMQLNAGTITISMTGTAGKGIRVDGTYTQGTEGGDGPTLTVSTTGAAYTSSSSSTGGGGGGWWGGGPGGGGPGGGGGGWGQNSNQSSAKAIKVQGAVTIYGGTSIITTTKDGAEGLESKTSVDIAGGTHYFKCYDDCINSSGIIRFSGGNTVCYSYGNDAVDSNYGKKGAITIAGGNIFAYSTKGTPEEGLDCDNNSYITITGGIGISAGGSQGGGGGWGGSSSSQSVGSSTQGYYLGSSPSSYPSTYYFTLFNTEDTAICTYKFEASVSNSLSLLTAPNLGKGTVTVKYSSSAPSASSAQVMNAQGTPVFFIAPTVTTKGTTASVTAK